MNAVADTAFLAAGFRARESSRPDALFHDPLAARLAGETGRAMVEKVAHLGEAAGWSTVLRTVLIDRFIEEAVAQGTQTLINLGAGLDTRPYRMAVPPSLAWVEVDQAPVIAHKSEVLANETPRCRLERVPLDLLDTASRRQLLSRVSKGPSPGMVLAEGLLPYLTENDVVGLLDDLRDHEAFQGLIVDYFAPEVMRARNAMPGRMRVTAAAMKFAPDDWQGFFAAHGWKVKEMRDLAAEGDRRGRPYVIPEAMRAMLQQGKDIPQRQPPGMFAAYALMERA
ncbi:MAG: class I SAM-dependent methyltransferase [Hyalangium sp.]|uniref:class I SAM-dependent methyltransferase n=1 Tax=Hyalangium sp. TaxID=2028555 RepID=UPI00389AA643